MTETWLFRCDGESSPPVREKGEPGAQTEATQSARQEDWRLKPRRPVEVMPSLLRRRGNIRVESVPTTAERAVSPPSTDSDTPCRSTQFRSEEQNTQN